MGRVKFRISYGQNQLAHAVEVSKLADIPAAEIDANVELSKQGGFLHDIGKAMEHNQEGTHAKLGAEFCGRYGVNSIVVNAIESHHHEVEQLTVEAVIAEAADAIISDNYFDVPAGATGTVSTPLPENWTAENTVQARSLYDSFS